MNKSGLTLFIFAILLNMFLSGQDKKPLSQADFDIWKDLTNSNISPSGAWVNYEIYMQGGEGHLWLYKVSEKKHISFDRHMIIIIMRFHLHKYIYMYIFRMFIS